MLVIKATFLPHRRENTHALTGLTLSFHYPQIDGGLLYVNGCQQSCMYKHIPNIMHAKLEGETTLILKPELSSISVRVGTNAKIWTQIFSLYIRQIFEYSE